MLYEKVNGLKDIELRFGTRVVSVSDESGSGPSLTLSDGSMVHSDLIIVADGVRSRLRDQILVDFFRETGPVRPVVSSLTAYQTQLSFENVRQNDVIGDLFQSSETILWTGQGRTAVTGGGSKMKMCVGNFMIDEGHKSTVSSEDATLWEEVRSSLLKNLAFIFIRLNNLERRYRIRSINLRRRRLTFNGVAGRSQDLRSVETVRAARPSKVDQRSRSNHYLGRRCPCHASERWPRCFTDCRRHCHLVAPDIKVERSSRHGQDAPHSDEDLGRRAKAPF